MTRWGHGHTFTAGLLAGLVLDHQAALLFGGGLLLGALIVAGWRKLAALASWAATIAGGFAHRGRA